MQCARSILFAETESAKVYKFQLMCDILRTYTMLASESSYHPVSRLDCSSGNHTPGQHPAFHRVFNAGTT